MVCDTNLIKFVSQTIFITQNSMETKQTNSDQFDEQQSIQVIREMIQVSQRKLKNDGILFILWGWVMFYSYISSYVLRKTVTTFLVEKIF